MQAQKRAADGIRATARERRSAVRDRAAERRERRRARYGVGDQPAPSVGDRGQERPAQHGELAGGDHLPSLARSARAGA